MLIDIVKFGAFFFTAVLGAGLAAAIAIVMIAFAFKIAEYITG